LTALSLLTATLMLLHIFRVEPIPSWSRRADLDARKAHQYGPARRTERSSGTLKTGKTELPGSPENLSSIEHKLSQTSHAEEAEIEKPAFNIFS
jgi:hypothetical protein